ncbi:MAG TPA: class I adenylate-forming enzyme family protein [Candidatus Baltobacteraceae bacterium]|nr:class I adenylate-forming enzyme family protein [Candidatus Baltobacteraceae bacterium]
MTLDDLRHGATIADVLRENVRVRAGAEAVTDGTRRLSWRELYEAANSSASHMTALGLHAGDRVAVVLPNQIESVILYWACALSGVLFVGINPRFGHDDLENILRHSGARFAFVGDDALARRIRELSLPGLHDVIAVEATDPVGLFTQPLRSAAHGPLVGRDDAFALCYTSGTTGRPKGAMLTHGNLVWNAATVAEHLGCGPEDTLLLTVGITHIFGLSAGVLAAAVAGARLVVLKTFAAAAALDLCEWEGVTILHGNPTMFVLELAAQRRAPRDLAALRTGIIAAAPVPPDLVDAVRYELHCDVQIAWGLTETAPAVTMTRSDDEPHARRVTVGRPLPGVRIQIDKTGHEYGEILVKSPGVFRGYFNDPELTRDSFTEDGWFRTGDLGLMDAAGYLHLMGRLKEIVIRGGLHVYPDEVERVLAEQPWIEAVALVGIPDAVLGERTCACVVLSEQHGVPDDLLAAIRNAIVSRLADYKVPDAVLRVAELPRNQAGKVLRGQLRQDAIARIAGG